MPDAADGVYKAIVVGTDGSPSAAAGVHAAAALALASGAELHIVGAYRPPTWRGRHNAAQARRGGKRFDLAAGDPTGTLALLDDAAEAVAHPRLAIQLHAVAAEPAQALCWVADRHGADLIVVGSGSLARGTRLVRQSVLERLDPIARCPVLTVDTAHVA